MLRLHPYEYHRPSTVEEALGLLDRHAGDVMPIAGGTDLVPNMKHRLFTPGHLVALRGIERLRGIAEVPGGAEGEDPWLRIGACESLDAVSRHPAVRGLHPALAEACAKVSGPQLRRLGTLGGNLCLDTRCTYYNQTFFWRKALGFCLKKDGDTCHVIPRGTRCVAAHSADTPPVLMVLDAEVEIAGPGGRRRIPVADLFTSDGVWNRRMEPGELVMALHLRPPPEDARSAFRKLRLREAVDFPILNLAVRARLEEDGTVRELRMVVSALGAYPRSIGKLEDVAVGRKLDAETVEAVGAEARRQCHPLENLVVDPEWRRAMVPVLVRRALEEIAAGQGDAAA